MSNALQMDADIRDRILDAPDQVLADQDVMRALVAAHQKTMGNNIVDLRGIAMDRLEARLDRLEETHRNVIAAAYENLAGTNQIHRAILRMLDPMDFETFLRDVAGEVADILRVDMAHLVLESMTDSEDPLVARFDGILMVTQPGFIDEYLGRAASNDRTVVLRQVQSEGPGMYGDRSDWIQSEACIRLDLGEGRLPGMLVMGSEDPHQFSAAQGTDLLTFFGGVFERSLRRWLA